MKGQICAAITMLTLLAASRMDLRTMTVQRRVWAAGGTPVLGILLAKEAVQLREGRMQETLISCIFLLLFFLLQQVLFARMYGRADCHAFCLCAACFGSMGYGFDLWIYQMTLAFGLLVIMQALQRNIARTGNLKRPVPFLPYITVSFVLWVDFIFW